METVPTSYNVSLKNYWFSYFKNGLAFLNCCLKIDLSIVDVTKHEPESLNPSIATFQPTEKKIPDESKPKIIFSEYEPKSLPKKLTQKVKSGANFTKLF